MARIKVLHVAECCAGGVGRYLKSLLKYSKCENIMILSQQYESEKEEYIKLAGQVEIMHMEHGMKFSALVEAIELRKRIKKYNPHVVFAHSSTAGAIARMACLGLNVKIIYNPHGWSFNMEGCPKRLFVILERIMSHFCDAIVCISEAEKVSALREKICKEEKLHVIENGIDIEEYKENEVNLSIPKDAFVIGMVGRICRQKAPDVFLKMAAEVKKEIKNAYFVIVGDAVEGVEIERKDIENLAKKLDIFILITGWVNNPLDYMKKFNVGCLLSRWEGFGLVIPEYMLAGIPIVATKVDAIPYLISDEETGLLVEKDDWKMASEKVIELAKNEELRCRLKENGLKTVRDRFDVRRVSMMCEELYKD